MPARCLALFHEQTSDICWLAYNAALHFRPKLTEGVLADVQLFGKEDEEADQLNSGFREPQPIKYDIKLAGFGTAAKLDSQGCAVQPSPYRCVSVLLDSFVLKGRSLLICVS